MTDLEKRIIAIEKRNRRVESDKNWETSWTRRSAIALLTYVVVITYLFVIGNDNPLINGLVPVGGFLLSTLALQRVKIQWEKRRS